MPINHFGERLRWCMDLVGAPYEEIDVGGILSIFGRARSVPWLEDRQSCSLIGNSDECMMYIGAVHVGALPAGSTKDKCVALFQRNPDTLLWEARLNACGHAI